MTECRVVEGDEPDQEHARVSCTDGGHGDRGGLLRWIAVHAGRDRRERHGFRADLIGHGEAVAITRRERLGLFRGAAPPHRPDGVNDEAGGEIEAVRDDGLPGRALADGAARGVKLVRSGGAMDGPIDAPTAAQLAVGRVDDGVDLLLGDIAGGCFEARSHDPTRQPPVVVPEVDVGARLSRDTACAGALTDTFSPQLENETVPWMVDECGFALGLVTSSIGSGLPVEGT